MQNKTGKSRFRPSIESLEQRLPLSITPTTNGHINIEGTNKVDIVTVRTVTVSGVEKIQVTQNDKSRTFGLEEIPGGIVFFYGYEGNDSFSNTTNLVSVVYAGAGNDSIYSAAGGYLYGETGNDTIRVGNLSKERPLLSGGEGNDTLIGSSKAEYFDGGDGDDNISCGGGEDYVDAGEGNDRVSGGAGNDTIFGGGGNDVLAGDDGNDQIDGGFGSDRITGGAGVDILWAGEDNSTNWLWGGAGNDKLYGGSGRDVMYGEDGNDQLVGGDGNDYLDGGKGQDYLYGQNGDDRLIGGNDGSVDLLVGGAGRDLIRMERYRKNNVWVNRDQIADFTTRVDTLYY